MNTAFVTGGTGFVGSHLVDELIKKGYHVRVLVRKTSNMRWLKNKEVELVEGSLNNVTSLKNGIKGANYVFHLAGVLFGRSEKAFQRDNVEGTRNLFRVCLDSKQTFKRILHCSTQAVAGPSQSKKAIDETTKCNPLTWYGKSKLEAENIALSYREKLPITIVRPGAVYGPRDYAIFEVFKTAKKGLNIRVGKEEKYASFIHVYDLIQGIILAATAEKSKGETYFLVSDDYSTQDAICIEAIKAFGKKVKNINVPIGLIKAIALISELYGKIVQKDVVLNRQKIIEIIQLYWICSNEKARKDFSFQPKWSLENGVKMTAEWYKENCWL